MKDKTTLQLIKIILSTLLKRRICQICQDVYYEDQYGNLMEHYMEKHEEVITKFGNVHQDYKKHNLGYVCPICDKPITYHNIARDLGSGGTVSKKDVRVHLETHDREEILDYVINYEPEKGITCSGKKLPMMGTYTDEKMSSVTCRNINLKLGKHDTHAHWDLEKRHDALLDKLHEYIDSPYPIKCYCCKQMEKCSIFAHNQPKLITEQSSKPVKAINTVREKNIFSNRGFLGVCIYCKNKCMAEKSCNRPSVIQQANDNLIVSPVNNNSSVL